MEISEFTVFVNSIFLGNYSCHLDFNFSIFLLFFKYYLFERQTEREHMQVREAEGKNR